jgi:hypothetical protein
MDMKSGQLVTTEQVKKFRDDPKNARKPGLMDIVRGMGISKGSAQYHLARIQASEGKKGVATNKN